MGLLKKLKQPFRSNQTKLFEAKGWHDISIHLSGKRKNHYYAAGSYICIAVCVCMFVWDMCSHVSHPHVWGSVLKRFLLMLRGFSALLSARSILPFFPFIYMWHWAKQSSIERYHFDIWAKVGKHTMLTPQYCSGLVVWKAVLSPWYISNWIQHIQINILRVCLCVRRDCSNCNAGLHVLLVPFYLLIELHL